MIMGISRSWGWSPNFGKLNELIVFPEHLASPKIKQIMQNAE